MIMIIDSDNMLILLIHAAGERSVCIVYAIVISCEE
jgi:hypothetical protein